MLSTTHAAGARRLALSALSLTLLLAASAAAARAQIGGAIDSDPSHAIGNRSTARNVLQGQITLPTGARLNQRVKVRIIGMMGGALFTMTDDNGGFVFQRLAGGSYNLTIEAGKEFETVNETVDIFDPGTRGGRGSTQTIHVQLRYRATAASTERAATIDAALAGVPKPALKQYERALKAAQSGDSKKAVEALKSAIELYPEFMLAHNQLGLLYLRLNQLNEAADALRTALRLAPDNFTPLVNYGIVLFYQKQYKEAAEQLRVALKRRDSSASAHFFLGRSLIKLGQLAEAEKELRQAALIGGPEVNEAYRFLGGIYMTMGDARRAVEALEKYLSLEPKPKDAEQVRQIVAQLRTQASAEKK